MYSQFRVQNFRGFKDLELKDLARINLIAGKNNVGKTSLLEAFFVFMNPTNLELSLRVNAIRGYRRIRIGQHSELAGILSPTFHEFNMERGFTVSGNYENGRSIPYSFTEKFASQKAKDVMGAVFELDEESALSASESVRSIPIEIMDIDNNVTTAWLLLQSDGNLQIKPQSESRQPTYFFASIVRESAEILAERHTKLINKGREDLLLLALQIIDSRIKNIRQTFQNGEPIISADIGMKQLMPINFLGDGVIRVLQFILAIANAENGVVLIDEIENGFHYSVLPKIWAIIHEAAELFNVQIFATTHSFEMIRAAHEAFSQSKNYDFAFHRLFRSQKTGEIDVVTYQQDNMVSALEMNLEMR